MYERFRAEKIWISSAAESQGHELSFYIFKGEVLGILGIDGEERDCMINVLTGAKRMTRGKLCLDGKELELSSIRDGQQHGIYLVQYESKLFLERSMAENFVLLYRREKSILLNRQKILKHLQRLSRMFDLDFDARQRAGGLSICQRHMFEIALAAYSGAGLIILDRVDTEYSEEEYRAYEKVIRMLQSRGISFLVIHTDIWRARALSGRVMVMRKGEKAGVYYTDCIKDGFLYKILAGTQDFGRSIRQNFRQPEVVLEALHLSSPGIVKDLSFSLNKGEIIGFVNEKYETMEKILLLLRGKYDLEGGKLYLEQRELEPFQETEIARRGIRYICRDSARDNVFLDLSVEENLQMESFKTYSYMGGWMNCRLCSYAMKQKSGLFLGQRKLKTPLYLLDHNERIMIALYRWKTADMKVLLMNSPAMQAEVVLKRYIWDYMAQICKNGVSVIYSSPSTEEMKQVCDRIYVVEDGKISRCLKGMSGENDEQI